MPYLKGVSKSALKKARLARIAGAAKQQIDLGILEAFAGAVVQDTAECLADCPGILSAYRESRNEWRSND